MKKLHCCDPEVHLLIVGGGSAAFAAALKAIQLGARVTLINEGLPIGGTCVNVGCVPSKTLIRAAEAHHRAGHHSFDGIASTSRVTDFKGVMAQKQQLVEGLRQAKYLDVVADLENFERLEGRARFVDPQAVMVNGHRLQAERLLIATGASPSIPPVPGLAESGYLTNTGVLELEELPESLLVLGGRYIALELSQMFARLGSKVTILQRSTRILPSETKDITEALTGYLEAEGIEIVTGVDLKSVRRDATPLEYVPCALAARDTRGFVKLIRERQTDRLVGARLLAPEGGELTMELSLAIRYGITVGDLARAFHPYLTLSEAVKLAALSFEKDVAKLSCCAT